jgi:adenylate cyclase
MTASSRDRLLLEISAFITEHALAGTGEVEVVLGVCERLAAGGVPLSRMIVGLDTLHPLVVGRLHTWRRGSGIETTEFAREQIDSTISSWTSSPFHHLFTSGTPLYRFRYPPPDGVYPFSVLAELAALGLTDYVACLQRLGDGVRLGELDCVYSSWATDEPGGFSDADVALFDALGRFLAASLVARTVRQIACTLAETYIGAGAAERVLRGAIVRGVADRIRAVVWFSDLKGFTSMVDTIDPALVLPLLDDYAEPQVAAIQAHGGTVLKFIGDGLLAIFPVGDDPAEACERALAATDAALSALAEVSARRSSSGLPTTGAYFALHIGDVFYGNIGGADRLDFTVIGPAVNEAARMSAMCRPLGRDVLVSQAFAAALSGLQRRLSPMGSHTLRGVAQPQALFAVIPEPRRRDDV